jgi:BirA family biotin operon repressor/biotin-[acetyl-CoA-carboxylase] ligase
LTGCCEAGLFTGPLGISPGWGYARYAEIDSTCRELQRRVLDGLGAKTAIVAERQSAGYGSRSRAWESAAGKGLWASFLYPVDLDETRLPESALVLAVAAQSAVLDATGIRLLAKWPNDLLHAGRKCCGLLVEKALAPEGKPPALLILGTGINVTHGEGDFSPAIAGTATSLFLVSGVRHDGTALLNSLTRHLDFWFGLWTRRGFAPVREQWLRNNCTVGRRIRLCPADGEITGEAAGIDGTGALEVRTAEGVRTVRASEIFFNL